METFFFLVVVEFEPDKENKMQESSWASVFMVISFFLAHRFWESVDLAVQDFWPSFWWSLEWLVPYGIREIL